LADASDHGFGLLLSELVEVTMCCRFRISAQTRKCFAFNSSNTPRRFSVSISGARVIDPRWTDEQKRRIKKGRTPLFEAAQSARDVADGKGDLEKLNKRVG
jgi:hypothetical protein